MPFKTTFNIIELQIFLLCVQKTCHGSQRAYVKFHLRNYYGHSLYEHTFLGLPNGILYLNPMRYHSDFIESTYCYQLSSIIIQSIENI